MIKNSLGFKGKQKNQFLDYEALENGCIYEFTYNPMQQPILTDSLGIKDFFLIMKDFFLSLKGCRVRMFMEVSKTGRFHFHGFLKMTDRLAFSIHTAPRLIERGSSKLGIFSNMDSYVRWLIYCNKQQNDIQEYLKRELYSDFDPKALSKRDPDGVITISNIV